MQYPSVRNLWPDKIKLFSESFKDLKIVLFINCLSWRHEFLMNNALKLAWFWFAHSCFLWARWFVRAPLRTLSFAVRNVCKNPRFITCYDMSEKLVIFDAFKKVKAHIPSVFLLFICENLWDQLGTNFLHAQFECQNFVDGLAIQIQHTTDHSGCQTSIRPHEIPHFGHVFFRFWRARSSTTRFVFHTLSRPSKNTLCHLKTRFLDRACSP